MRVLKLETLHIGTVGNSDDRTSSFIVTDLELQGASGSQEISDIISGSIRFESSADSQVGISQFDGWNILRGLVGIALVRFGCGCSTSFRTLVVRLTIMLSAVFRGAIGSASVNGGIS